MLEYNHGRNVDSCIVLVHIPRTGGTTLRRLLLPRLLRRMCPEEIFLIDIGPEYGCRTGSLADLAALDPHVRQELRFVTGHMSPAVADLVRRPLVATVVRDPVERALSDYWYTFHEPSNAAHPMAHEYSEVEYVARAFGQSRNGHARYLSGVAFSGEMMEDEVLFTRAKAGLDRVDYVGLFEQLDDVVDDLCTLAGLNPVSHLPWLNNAPRLGETSDHDRRLIAAYNWVDSALYAMALGKWIERHGGLKGLHLCESSSVE